MPLTNAATHYGTLTKVFHWAIALGILIVIPLGIVGQNLPFETSDQLARKAMVFSLHKTVGITIFFVALARIAWAIAQPKPAHLHPERTLEMLAADTVQWVLYGSLILVPLTGWIHHASSTGYAPILWPFGQSLPLIPKDVAFSETFATLHMIFERVMVAALLLHIAGALKHHFLDKDATLRRMWFGRTEAGGPEPHQPRRVAPVLAVGVWVVVLGTAASVGTFRHDAQAARPALAAVASDWTVSEGSLGLTVRQFGSDIVGGFEDWTAAIQFDETVAEGDAGSVDVTVSIPSLSLGSVTDQAMGPDFFDATAFATATYSGPIISSPDGYIVDGTLDLKGAQIAAPLPFTLELADDTARVSGQLTLDRRDFKIGAGVTDEGQLGFEVIVDVVLTATRS